LFNSKAYWNSRPDGIPVLEVVDQHGASEGSDAERAGQSAGSPEVGPRLFVPLKRTELRGEVTGPLAALRLTQVFGYTRQLCNRVLEAVYRFPLPGDAAVTAVTVRFGDVEIQAALKERQKAEAEYDEAKRQGQQAALATRESPDVFTLQVAGLKPDEDVTVLTSYVQLASPQGAGWSLRIPLTTAPRYVRSDEVTSRHARGQPLALLRDPGHRFLMDVTIAGAARVSSATHTLDIVQEQGGLRVRLQGGEVLPDRDCVLLWLPDRAQARPTLDVMTHTDRQTGQVYFLALVAPPAGLPAGGGAAREAILLVDHSGSMEGAKWQAADWAVKQFLSGLTQRDALALGLFHNTVTWFSSQPRQVDGKVVEEATRFLVEHTDSGGTELGVALEQAVSLKRSSGEMARHLLVVTDAEVSDEGRILRLADEESRQSNRRRISVLCIDAAPNAFLASQLAERGGGVARFLTSAPEEEDITTALDEVLSDWGEPVLTGLRLELSRGGAEASDRELLADAAPGWSAIDLGDLPAGRPIWVCGRAPLGDGRVSLRLVTGGKEVASTVTGTSADSLADRGPALRALFGARRVTGLEFLISSGRSGDDLTGALRRLGYDPKAALTPQSGQRAKLYAENVREDATAALRGLLASEALIYGLACSETSFVAVRKEKGQPVEGTVAVANALPAGWSDKFVSGPGGPAVPVHFSAMMAQPSPSAPPSLRSAGVGAAPAMLRRKFARPRADLSMGAGAPEAEPMATVAAKREPVFTGRPVFADGEAVLLDTARAEDDAKAPAAGVLTKLMIRFAKGTPPAASLDPGLCLLIFVDDLASPRARVRLADLARLGLERPLNIARSAGQVVKVVLADAGGVWAAEAPEIAVILVWG
jgi:Ca-activated chloride channel family protein